MLPPPLERAGRTFIALTLSLSLDPKPVQKQCVLPSAKARVQKKKLATRLAENRPQDQTPLGMEQVCTEPMWPSNAPSKGSEKTPSQPIGRKPSPGTSLTDPPFEGACFFETDVCPQGIWQDCGWAGCGPEAVQRRPMEGDHWGPLGGQKGAKGWFQGE